MKLTKLFTKPPFVLGFGLTEVVLVFIIYQFIGLGDNNFFVWGPPIVYFQTTITSVGTFYAVLCIYLLHQLIYNWVYEVLQPWIYTEIQNNNFGDMRYSTWKSIILVNLYYTYLSFANILIIQGAVSQISFLIITLIAEWCIGSYINYRFILRKNNLRAAENKTEEV